MYPVGANRESRCHFHEQAPSLPHAAGGDITDAAERTFEPLLNATDLSKTFKVSGVDIHALARGADANPRGGDAGAGRGVG